MPYIYLCNHAIDNFTDISSAITQQQLFVSNMHAVISSVRVL